MSDLVDIRDDIKKLLGGADSLESGDYTSEIPDKKFRPKYNMDSHKA